MLLLSRFTNPFAKPIPTIQLKQTSTANSHSLIRTMKPTDRRTRAKIHVMILRTTQIQSESLCSLYEARLEGRMLSATQKVTIIEWTWNTANKNDHIVDLLMSIEECLLVTRFAKGLATFKLLRTLTHTSIANYSIKL